ncbi:MAG: DNRLRE domain-containing protein, partial [Anaerolineaceae bacterium]|nr:DNRLRE domain-containing protein [Anaerolineaceae bacterium]
MRIFRLLFAIVFGVALAVWVVFSVTAKGDSSLQTSPAPTTTQHTLSLYPTFDTYLAEYTYNGVNYQNRDMSAENQLALCAQSAWRRNVILKFDLSPIPHGAVITHATLVMNFKTQVNGTTPQYGIYRISGYRPINHPTWINYNIWSSLAWTGPGATYPGMDYHSTPLWTGTLPSNSNLYADFNLTEFNHLITDGNYGLLIRSLTTVNGADRNYYSSESAYTPRIDLVYTTSTTGSHDYWWGNQTTSAGCLASGWAVDYANWASRLNVTTSTNYWGGWTTLATGLANGYRSDLSGVCSGGNCLYWHNLAWKAPVNANFTVRSQAQAVDGTWFDIPNTYKTLRSEERRVG